MQFALRFHVFELSHVRKRKRQLEIIHNVKDDDVVALRLELLESRNNVLRLIVQVRNQNNDASAREVFGQKSERFSKFGLLAWLDTVDLRQYV